jgi:hypothetical protein
MADNFKFPDEVESVNPISDTEGAEPFEVEIEVVDDTPDADKGRHPLAQEAVADLENDDLEEYSDKVKKRMSQMKRVWHDERREKEQALREQQEAVTFAQRVLDENKRLKNTLSEGAKQYATTAQSAADMEVEAAKRQYRDAYDSGDADQIIDAQQKMTEASLRQDKVRNFKLPLQEEDNDVQIPQHVQPQSQKPNFHPTTAAWMEKNPWYGPDTLMTGLAMSKHAELTTKFGPGYAGTDEYFDSIDKEIRQRFPEKFETQTQSGNGKPSSRNESRPATVVAPATRSTASKKIVLKASQVAIARKFGLTPEQYAREVQKLEA